MKHTKKTAPLALLLIAALIVSLMSGVAYASGGEVIADNPLNGSDSINLTLTNSITADSGVGADITSNNNPLTVMLEGGVSVEDHGAYGENAIGVRAYAVPGGTIDLTLKNGASVLSDENIAYGVHLETKSEGIVEYYYVNEGQTVPVNETGFPSCPATISENGIDVTDEIWGDEHPRVFFAKRADAEDAWDVFLVVGDATAVGWSKTPIPELTVKTFLSYVTGAGEVTTHAPIDVTICTADDPDGREFTLMIDRNGTGANVYCDYFGKYFLNPVGTEEIHEITAANDGKVFTLESFSKNTPYISADIGGQISAAAEKACGMNVLPYQGPIDVTLDAANIAVNGESWAWGVNANTANPMTLNGHDVSISASSDSSTGTASAVGILLKAGANTSSVNLTGQNSINVRAAAAPAQGEYSGGIVVLSSGLTVGKLKAGDINVRYTGDITVSGLGMVGVETLATTGGTSSVTMFGNVTLSGSDSDGLYVSAEKSVALGTPKSELFLRGDVNLTDAKNDAAGVSANGCPVIVDGNISVSGADTLYGVYAYVGAQKLSNQGATVLVTGSVTAPTAVYIPIDTDTITNNSRVYVWNYDGALAGKTENLGFVIKPADGLDAELSAASLYSVTKEGETYYGADPGDTVTVVTNQAEITVLDAHGGRRTVERTEDGFTFTMPEDCGVTVYAGHRHQLTAVPGTAATCTDPGSAAYWRCESCGKFFSDAEGATEIDEGDWIIPALGHDFGKWITVTEPTESSPGAETRSCARCGAAENREIPPAVHECPSARFTDVDLSQWYHEELDYVVANGLMVGVSDTSFAPGKPITRAMVVTAIWRLEGQPDAPRASFADISENSWYESAVNWAVQAQITRGISETKFAPDLPATREMLATFFFRYAQYKGLDTEASASLEQYQDANRVSDWALEAVIWAKENRIINGLADDLLAPTDKATRIQFAAMLHRCCVSFAESLS